MGDNEHMEQGGGVVENAADAVVEKAEDAKESMSDKLEDMKDAVHDKFIELKAKHEQKKADKKAHWSMGGTQIINAPNTEDNESK